MLKKVLKSALILSAVFLSAGEIDPPMGNNPEVSIDRIKYVTEGNSGEKNVDIVVKVNKCPSSADINLNYFTQNGSAKSPSDYNSKNGTIIFRKSNCTKTKTITVKVKGDTEVEDNEYFYLKLSNNSTPPYQMFHYKDGRTKAKIVIKNDDGVVLDAGKYLVDNDGDYIDYGSYNLNDTITFVLIAQNQGPNSSTIKVKDDLPDSLELIPGSLKITNNVKNYSCSASGNKIRCSGSHKFGANEEARITYKAKAVKEGSFDNYVWITDNDGKYKNGDHVDFDILNRGDGVGVSKTVNKNSAEIGEQVTFNVRVENNTPVDRVLEIRDWFPTTGNGESYSGTTKNAFTNVTLPTVVNDPSNSVKCEWRENDNGGKYIFCSNSKKLKPGEGFEVKFDATVAKAGRICNRVHSYLEGWVWMNYSDACLNGTGNNAPVIDDLEDKNAYVGRNFGYKFGDKIHDPDGDPLSVEVLGLPDGFVYDSKRKKIYARPVTAEEGVYTVTVKVTDDPSAHGGEPKTVSKTFKIYVKYPKVKAKDNDYEIGINETLEGNVITDNTGKGVDRGIKLAISNYSFLTQRHGAFTIHTDGRFTYKPDQDFRGEVKFKYTIIDAKGNKSSAYVTITVKTQFNSEFKDFELINPLETRNIIGNYVIAGNTVECVTDSKKDFGGTCQKDRAAYYNNKYITKYIDIDNSDLTWNSSSSSFELPKSFLESGNGKTIVWAGLFWQGNINNSASFTKGGVTYRNIQRRKYMHNGAVEVKNIESNEALDITQTGADKVLVKVDSENEYHEIEASRFYYDTEDYGDNGATYAAFADITALLQSKKLKKGKHTLTVANIVSNEGLEQDNGDYGGWSLVVIYKEDFINGRARNISIYNGFTAVDKAEHGSQQIEISGFKLPKEGKVNSQFSVFAGEGELKYGAPNSDPITGEKWYDTMRIKRKADEEGDIMPGADNPNNIFDAKLANILRDNIGDNNIENTDGIDIDTYDVSSIITRYRDNNPDINKVYISISSNKDYITPSMIAFSTDLYAPKVCYDSDIKIGKYLDIEDYDGNFSASNLYDKPLQVKVMIKSQEADFDLLDSKLRVTFEPDDVFEYRQGESKTTYPNTFEYEDAIDTMPNSVPPVAEIAIGSNPTIEGGTIGAKEFTYSKMLFNFIKSDFTGRYNIELRAKVSFDGVHKVSYPLSTKAPEGSMFNIPKCSGSSTYDPIYGTFNVERGDSKFRDTAPGRYSLYTQVTGVPYKVSVAAYQKGSNGKYNTQGSADTTVEMELIDASTFDNNSSLGFDSICRNPEHYNAGAFVHFNKESRKTVNIPEDFPKINGKTTYPENLALKNAAFRVWVLTKKVNGKNLVVKHHCKNQWDSVCFKNLYKKEYTKDKLCSADCGASSRGSKCYQCLRKHYATPICSRDNFAIRPQSYSIALSDNNQTFSSRKMLISKNRSDTRADIAAGYLYHLDINATKYGDLNGHVYGYYLRAFGDNNKTKSLALFKGSSECNDTSDKAVRIKLFNGTTIKYQALNKNNSAPLNGLLVNNSGIYDYRIEDKEWTIVDQKGSKYKPFKNIADCESGLSDIAAGSRLAKRGCNIVSNFDKNHKDLALALHPYKFRIDSISANATPNSGANYFYMNNLQDTKNLIANGSVMGLRVNGAIVALGKNGTVLSNYTKSCSAKNLNISMQYGFNQDRDFELPNLQYSIYNSDIDYTVNVSSISNPGNSGAINAPFDKKYFKDSNATLGSAIFNSYINFARTYNYGVNPFAITIAEFDVNSPQDKLFADLNSNYIPQAKRDINSTRTVYYAKVKPENDFYDDITDNSVQTPIMAVVYCSKSLDYCQKFGIDTDTSATNEYDWWIAKNHSIANGDGKIILAVSNSNSSHAQISPNDIPSLSEGRYDNVRVSLAGNPNRPYTVTIVPSSQMRSNYPWMLFNSAGVDAPPSKIEKARFVKTPAGWSGAGKTGNAIEVTKSHGRKTKKIDW